MISRAGYGLAAISYDSAAVLKEFAGRKSIRFPLLSDHDSRTIRAYRVENREFRKGYELDVDRELVSPTASGNVPVYGVAYPAVFAIDAERKVVWRFVSPDAEFRLTAAAILERALGTVDATQRTEVKARHARISTTATDRSLGLGTRVGLGVQLELPAGWHAYAAGAGPIFRPLAWTMAGSNCAAFEAVRYPETRTLAVPPDGERVPVYEGAIRLAREMSVAPAIRPAEPQVYRSFLATCLDANGQFIVRGSLQLQLCSDKECYPPEAVPLEWKFQFVPPDRERASPDLRREFEN